MNELCVLQDDVPSFPDAIVRPLPPHNNSVRSWSLDHLAEQGRTGLGLGLVIGSRWPVAAAWWP